MGQWNKIKEKMEWSLTEGGIDRIYHKMGATSPTLERVRAIKLKEKFLNVPIGGLSVQCNFREIQTCGNEPRNNVGQKRRGYADGFDDIRPGSNTMQSQADREENLGRKRTRALENDTSSTEKTMAVTAMQSRQAQ